MGSIRIITLNKPRIDGAIMFTIKPMNQQDAEEICSWRYPVPYSMYDLTNDAIPDLLNDENRYYCVFDGYGELLGFCCFGEEAKVPGGNYDDQDPGIMDVGLGMRPDRTGQGLGGSFIYAILAFAQTEFSMSKFRVTIAAFNMRSQRAFIRQGFMEYVRFQRTGDGMEFTQFQREDSCLDKKAG
jgi:RimJ/RimL family protein N-acetyltransferase